MNCTHPRDRGPGELEALKTVKHHVEVLTCAEPGHTWTFPDGSRGHYCLKHGRQVQARIVRRMQMESR